MTPAIRSDLTKHRKKLLAALAAGGRGSQPPEEAWLAIESIIRRCRKRMLKAQRADEKKRSKDKLNYIVRAISRISETINNMKERERKWICRELGRDSETASARDAHTKGSNIMDAYLMSSRAMAHSARAAVIPIKRKKNNERSTGSRLIREADDLWRKTHGKFVLNSNVKERQFFDKFAISTINVAFGDEISNTMFNQYLKEARKAPSEESEESDEMMC